MALAELLPSSDDLRFRIFGEVGRWKPQSNVIRISLYDTLSTTCSTYGRHLIAGNVAPKCQDDRMSVGGELWLRSFASLQRGI